MSEDLTDKFVSLAIRKAAIKECSDLMRRWADDAASFGDENSQRQANCFRNAAIAIDNLAKDRK